MCLSPCVRTYKKPLAWIGSLFSMAAQKRKCLSVADKLKIIESVKSSSRTRKEVCDEYGIGLSSVSKFLNDEDKLRAVAVSNRNVQSKKFRSSSYDTINNAVTTWFQQVRAANVQISGPLIMEQAKKFAIEMELNFEPNNGWLQRWKTANNITFHRSQGEQASADHGSADQWTRNVLPNLITDYEPCDIYNADESGLFYKAVPTGTMAVAGTKPTSTKLQKVRLTALFLTNQTGTDKQVFVIGNARKPRCFAGVHQLPLPYFSNSKAWMTIRIWSEILKQWDVKLRHKVLLFCDNAACHKLVDGVVLRFIEIVFLPPNTTSLIQPLDQGIIRCVKVYYRKELCRRQLASLERQGSLENFMKQFTLLRAMHLLKHSWWLVQPETITNCFGKAGFFTRDEEVVDELEHVFDELPVDRDEFLEVVQADSACECHGVMTDAEICAEVRVDDVDENDEPIPDDIREQPSEPVSAAAVLEHFECIRTYLDQHPSGAMAMPKLYELEQAVARLPKPILTQRTLHDFFS